MESGGDSYLSHDRFPWDPSIMKSVLQETTRMTSTLIPSTTLIRARPTMKLLPSCGSFRQGQIIYCPPGWTFGWIKRNVTYCCYPQDYVAS